MITLATIGYEGAALADFIATLSRAGIERAIDVREIEVVPPSWTVWRLS